ncbi:efflux RND transporter periplasmic adaptor subunit, partial [Stenotrophomonas sp.]|uniref:efflux RND transporter periplasmic adaptor subunit n=1 Tax=Stenotrophomonas sp. TaxID=69392 RepID=UPI0028AE1339
MTHRIVRFLGSPSSAVKKCSGHIRLGIVISVGVLSIGLGAAAWAVLSRTAAQEPTPSQSSLSVRVTEPLETQWARTLDASGVIAPWQEAIIGAQTSGLRITQINAAVGDAVRQGQLLARFDAATLRAEQLQLEATLAQARAVAAQADANRARALQLERSGAISAQEVKRYVTEAVTAKAQVTSAQAQLEAKRLQLRQADVVAPDDGVISARSATLGAVASNGQELFRLVRKGRLEWRGEFTAHQLASVVVGQTVVLRLPDGQSAKARVRQIAPLLDTRSRLGLVYADIESNSIARGGMYVDGRIELAPSPALVVPAASVVVRDGRSIVFRVEGTASESIVQAQPVTVGRRQGSQIEILDPFQTGQRIVAQGAGLLDDGDTVRIEPEVPTPHTGGQWRRTSIHE